jgi:hypothetical protein
MATKNQNPPPTTDPPPLPPNRKQPQAEAKPSFEQMMLESMQRTVIEYLRKGDWLTVEYRDKFKVEPSLLREVMQKIDMAVVIERVKEHVEQKGADKIMHSMEQEVANDVKSIMSNRELREDIRSVIRQKIRDCSAALSKGES